MPRDMQPAALQPLGFWSVRAGEAIQARTRGRLSDLDVSQPEWWVLHQLSMHSRGMREAELVSIVGPNESDESIVRAIAAGVEKGWLGRAGDHVRLTELGVQKFDAAAEVQKELNDERRQGISDEDYATTIEVLQRTITNVGGTAWHW
ncbi:winged helix DNA-binding protein [Arthrobacter sp. SLBN-53]|uniref:MarR family winged helix-turn-helix transcriptional regulator n=1 Tax=Arthrobacter sp. SLBN-53 TaxID=2768412 RepID=UPI00114D9941|nr:winged helix DNA-binding protein [Arthrobacter sp. SLBN-53]TQK29931.1 winged helix DNA-binding protein [Arthrobacter sp. SLBN-53]